MKTIYEWAVEEKNANDDILDVHYSDKFSEVKKWSAEFELFDLVLVRDVVDNMDGVTDRTWAYVKDGKLPEYFQTADGRNAYKVPQRFFKEAR